MSEIAGAGGPTIRFFQPQDFALIVAASAESGWAHLTPADQALTSREAVAQVAYEQTAGVLATPGGVCFVAEDQGQVVAYELLLIRPDEVSGIMEGLKVDGWVHPAYRGRGLNRLMHETGETWCRQQGIRRMSVIIAAHNLASLRATDKSGFETVRLIRGKWL